MKINQLGDAIWLLPAVAAIRREFPESRIDIVCDRSTSVIFEKSVKRVSTFAVFHNHVRRLRGLVSLPSLVFKLGFRRHAYALLSHDDAKFSYLLALPILARGRLGFDIVNRDMAPRIPAEA
jgi:ADP-heptose:LPS heptosyltransferase